MNSATVHSARRRAPDPISVPTFYSWSLGAAAQVRRDLTAGPMAPVNLHGAPDRGAATDAEVKEIVFADRRPIAIHPRSDEHLYRLVEGWACCGQVLVDGARQITDVLIPGDVIPTGLFRRRSHRFETFACGKARVVILGRDRDVAASDFRHLRERARETELRILRSRLVSLGRRDARARVAHFFAELHARLDRAGLVMGDAFAFPLTQEQIADVLGLTAVHVNRTLKLLRAHGLLMVNRPQVVIPDLDRLRDAAGFEIDADDYSEGDDHGAL